MQIALASFAFLVLGILGFVFIAWWWNDPGPSSSANGFEAPRSDSTLDRLLSWLNDYVSHWALILWSAAAGTVGLVIGLLVGGGANADWVEASGTWAAVAVTLAAVLVAYRAFTTESFDRAIERHTDMARREEERLAELHASTVEASKVEVGAHYGMKWGTTNDDGIEMTNTNSVRFVFKNLSSRLVTNIHAQVEIDVLDSPMTARLGRLEAGGTDSQQKHVARDKTISVPKDPGQAIATLADSVVLEFDLDGRRWRRRGTNEPTPL